MTQSVRPSPTAGRPTRRGAWAAAGVAVAVAVALAVAPGAARAVGGTILYVDRGNAACSDSGAGTIDQPYCTIGAAARVVAAGQTVQVAAGAYPEAVTVASSGTSSAPIVFTASPGATVTLSGQANGFYVSTKSWVTVNGFTITNTSDRGVYVSGSSHITISNNHVSYSGQPVSGLTKPGIYLSNVSDSLVAGNTADHNTDAGILLTSGSTRDEVRGNVTFSNARGYTRAAPGIRLYSSPSNTVDGNITHNNEDSGIESYSGSNDTLIYDNVAYDNGDHGIDNYVCTGQRVIANTVYNNVTAGINIEGGSTGATIANNVSVDNGIASPRTTSDIRVENGSTSGTTMDYDVAYLTRSSTLLIWNSVSYSSLAAFQSATGQELHGIQADPGWVNVAGRDFHLAPGSPAIDSANSGVSGQPSVDVEGNGRYDDAATPNTGTGPRTFDDRGAYELTSNDAPPAASVSVNPASGPVPFTVTADASASTDTDDTPIASYTFDFGDGTVVGPQAGPTADHTYNSVGSFTVTVTVRDTGGQASGATATVAVQAPEGDLAPAAALSVTPTSGTAPVAVTADASGSTDTDATPIASFTFDFGDGAVVGPQAGATAGHTYTSAGTFTVTVTVRDTIGQASTSTATVSVQPDLAPVASLSVSPNDGRAPLFVTADASGSADNDTTPIATYTFDFGDGTVVGPQASPTATHTFTRKHPFTVRVTVTDTAGLSSTASQTVRAR
jgi:parallel beta-helix repeat protein